MVATPFLAFYLIGLVFDADTLFIIKFFLCGCIYAILYVIKSTFFDDHLMALLPLSVYLATKLWFYVTWFMYIKSSVSTFTTLLFLLCSAGLWVCFLKSWRGDPGILKPTQEQRFKVCYHMKYLDRMTELLILFFYFRQ